jgi:hypothetical protein
MANVMGQGKDFRDQGAAHGDQVLPTQLTT